MSFKKDAIAWLSVFFVAIPLCLWIANAVHVSPLAWLIAWVLWWIVVWLLSKSPLSVSWPAAWLITIMLWVIVQVWFKWLLVATALAWIIQLILGIFKASKVSKYIPASVIQWMLAWIGLILILKQLPLLFWVADRKPLLSWNLTWALTWQSLVIVAVWLLLWFIWSYSKKVHHIPMWIVIVLLTSTIAFFVWLWSQYLIHIPSSIHLQDFWLWTNMSEILWLLQNTHVRTAAITIAIVASIETILSIHAIDHLDEKKRVTPLDRELVAQWTANIIAWILWWLPITSVIVRSTVNHHAWAQSKLAAIIHGVLIAGIVLLFPGIINLVPVASLAVILIATWYKLCAPKHVMKQFHHAYPYRISFLLTWVFVVATDLLLWVGLGCVVYYLIQPKYLVHIFGHRSWLYISQK